MVNPKSLANLKPVQKGQVLNPKGRGKGVPNTKTRMQRILMLEQTITNPVNGKREKFTVAEQMDLAMIKEARNGNVKAYNAVVDRLEGKVGDNGGGNININFNATAQKQRSEYGIS